MTLQELAQHYLGFPEALWFMLVSAVVTAGSVLILAGSARISAREYVAEDRPYYIHDRVTNLFERYTELLFSGGSILMFVGVYFLIDYFGIGIVSPEDWEEYGDFLLLLFILLSVIFNNLLDHVFMPLRHISDSQKSALRLVGMVYMVVIFAYIKFIYEDNNYDRIIQYYLGLMIGRFVYFDTTWKGFADALKDAAKELPILCLCLADIALISWYGFGTEYLLKANGVAVSLFIAHIHLFLALFIIRHCGLLKALAR